VITPHGEWVSPEYNPPLITALLPDEHRAAACGVVLPETWVNGTVMASPGENAWAWPSPPTEHTGYGSTPQTPRPDSLATKTVAGEIAECDGLLDHDRLLAQ